MTLKIARNLMKLHEVIVPSIDIIEDSGRLLLRCKRMIESRLMSASGCYRCVEASGRWRCRWSIVVFRCKRKFERRRRCQWSVLVELQA